MIEHGVGSASWAQKYIGIPYRQCGRSLAGIDCYGLVWLVYRDVLGIELPDWMQDASVDFEGDFGQWVEIDYPAELCIVRSPRNNWADHMGIYVGGAVLNAAMPVSCAPALEQYLMVNPGTKFGVFEISMSVLS